MSAIARFVLMYKPLPQALVFEAKAGVGPMLERIGHEKSEALKAEVSQVLRMAHTPVEVDSKTFDENGANPPATVLSAIRDRLADALARHAPGEVCEIRVYTSMPVSSISESWPGHESWTI